jgi:hypothetical protein
VISAKQLLGLLALASALAFAVFAQRDVSRLQGAFRLQTEKAAQIDQELQTLRAEAGDEERDVQESIAAAAGGKNSSTRFPPGSDAALEAEIAGWLGRVAALRRAFDEHPGEWIPELALLTEHDWKKVAKISTVRRSFVDANGEFDVATELNLAPAREMARTAFLDVLNEAILRFRLNGQGELPSGLDQLVPFLPAAIAPSALARYEFSTEDGRISIAERSTPAVAADERLGILEYGRKPPSWLENAAERAIREANRRFAAAHGGADATAPAELAPYLAQPMDEDALAENFRYLPRTMPAAAATPP